MGSKGLIKTPFLVNFRSDAYEGAAAIGEALTPNAGFTLTYIMDANCVLA